MDRCGQLDVLEEVGATALTAAYRILGRLANAEDVAQDTRADPVVGCETTDAVAQALDVVITGLTPQQQVAFLLYDVFGYSFAEIATITGASETAARQQATRARRQVTDERPRFAASNEAKDALAERFTGAARSGELEGLEVLLVAAATRSAVSARQS